MHYQLYQARDRRDGVVALWLLRAPAGEIEMRECAYLGTTPKVKDLGRHVSRIKQITFCRTNFYVFENMAAWATHCDHDGRRMLGQWEVS